MRLSVAIMLLSSALWGTGCATHRISPDDELSNFVGDRVSIEGVVAQMTTYVPGDNASGGWCLTLTRDWRRPRSEVSLSGGAAVVVFDVDANAGTPSRGERVRVTGRLVRAVATVRPGTQPTYAIEKAKWSRLRD